MTRNRSMHCSSKVKTKSITCLSSNIFFKSSYSQRKFHTPIIKYSRLKIIFFLLREQYEITQLLTTFLLNFLLEAIGNYSLSKNPLRLTDASFPITTSIHPRSQSRPRTRIRSRARLQLRVITMKVILTYS